MSCGVESPTLDLWEGRGPETLAAHTIFSSTSSKAHCRGMTSNKFPVGGERKYVDIQDHGLIGNLHTAAMVSFEQFEQSRVGASLLG